MNDVIFSLVFAGFMAVAFAYVRLCRAIVGADGVGQAVGTTGDTSPADVAARDEVVAR
ncbi:MAG: hypothetical protein ABJH68_00750 [Ilumatobacter sp.]|uniref:hypothetical protein n=1 Tax=Ilumatobacter sp. TaxID=1967498 RepID=UPI0032970968